MAARHRANGPLPHGAVAMRRRFPRPNVFEGLALLVAVVAALTAVAPRHFRFFRDRRATAVADMDSLAAALETYRHDVKQYPETEQGLRALVAEPASWAGAGHWDGPYVLRPIPVDPWGHRYVYRAVQTGGVAGFVLTSYGADGRPGGSGSAADVTIRPPGADGVQTIETIRVSERR